MTRRHAPRLSPVLLGPGLLLGLLQGLLLPGGASGEGFGRWQTSTSRCTLERGSDGARPCQELRLEQNLSGLLSVRFLSDASTGLLAEEQLLFAGLLEKNQPAMVCDRQGKCKPQWPTGLAVATVGDSRFNERGLAIGLPQAYLARGHCTLEQRRILCEAQGRDGERWRAEAEL